jgi:hypothetical protein
MKKLKIPLSLIFVVLVGFFIWLQYSKSRVQVAIEWIEDNEGVVTYEAHPWLKPLPEKTIRFFNGYTPVYLDFQKAEITNLDKLKPLKSLQVIDLNKSKVKDISAIEYFKDLKEIYLEFTLVQDISALEGLSIEKLNISNTAVKNIDSIFSLKSLKRLEVSGIPIENSVLEELQKALPNCIILR